MLTGERPFSGDSAVAIAVQHTNSRVPPPSALVPGISAAVDDLVLHMTEPAPQDRPADATEVLILVQHLVEHPQTAERLADQRHQEHDATEVFDVDRTRSHDSDATVPFGAVEDDLQSPANPPPPPDEPKVTVLPPAVTAEAAPIDLLEQQLSGLPPAEMNMYKQRMPFHTLLKLRGELLKPEISFDITTDETNVSVTSSVLDNTKAKLAQLRTEEAEMNKQVFALLLLNRFVGENPFESNSGLSAETLARQSVSKILSQQLNNLTSDLIAGVDLNFDLESTEDYSSGQKNTRTDLNVGVSKRLLNDRLKVSVGSDFGIEGDARQNENTTNIAGDVTIDYMLSKDGRYMLRAYRKDEYQVALQGQIIETGVGFIITLDYDKFRDIFLRNKKKNKNEDAVEFK